MESGYGAVPSPLQVVTCINEASLLATAHSGDTAALETLCRAHAEQSFRIVHRVARNREDSDDAVQDCPLRRTIRTKHRHDHTSSQICGSFNSPLHGGPASSVRQQIVCADVNEFRAHSWHRSEPGWPRPHSVYVDRIASVRRSVLRPVREESKSGGNFLEPGAKHIFIVGRFAEYAQVDGAERAALAQMMRSRRSCQLAPASLRPQRCPGGRQKD